MLFTKIEAARRQIDAAIELYFHEGDELATHTLVGAAHILITDLSKAAQLESILDRYIVFEVIDVGADADLPRGLCHSNPRRRRSSDDTTIRESMTGSWVRAGAPQVGRGTEVVLLTDVPLVTSRQLRTSSSTA